MPPEMSPVYAPAGCGDRSCAPYTRSSLSPSTAVCTLRRAVNGGSTATSTSVSCCSLRLNASFCTRLMASRWLRFIFQLPAMMGRRVVSAMLTLFLLAGLSLPLPAGAVQRGETRQGLAFEVFQRRAATGRDVPERGLVEPERADRRGRIAAPDHGEAVDLGDRLGHAPGAGRERGQLEHAHRPVPEHRPRGGDGVREQPDRLRSDVQP